MFLRRRTLLVLLLLLYRTESRHLQDFGDDSEGADDIQAQAPSRTLHHHRSIGAPTMIFGNPDAFYGSGKVGGASTSTWASPPISLDAYAKLTTGLKDDEAIARNIILSRFKRSDDRGKEYEYYDEEEEDESREEGSEEAGSQEQQQHSNTLKRKRQISGENGNSTSDKISTTPKTSTSVASSSSPAPAAGTNLTGTQGTNLPPWLPPVSPATKNGTGKSFPPGLPPGGVFSGPPSAKNGSGKGVPFGIPGIPLPGGIPGLPPGLRLPGLPPPGGGSPKAPGKKGEIHLPEGYSNLEIPKLDAGRFIGFSGGKLSPVPTLVFLNIRSIRDIDELNEFIVLDMDMKVEWVDGILFDPFTAKGKLSKIVTLNPDFMKKVWSPDIYVDEIIRVLRPKLMKRPQTFQFAPTSGLMSFTFRTAVHLQCQMDFFYYPSDTHRCKFHLRSYSYFDSDLEMNWLRNGVYLQDPGDPNFDLAVDDVKRIKIDQVFNESNNNTYDGLEFTVVARRKLSYHMVQTYLPSVFFIVITWLCFLVPARMVEARIGISMTTLLTLTAMFSSVRESTPIVSYVKAIDIWMVFCIFFVFLTLLEFSLLVWIRSFREDAEEKRLEQERARQKRRGLSEKHPHPHPHPHPPISTTLSNQSENLKRYESLAELTEKWAFLLFSLVFTVFCVVYWSWLLSCSEYYNWAVNASHNAPLED